MQATLPFLLFTVLFSSAAMAQCGGGSSSSDDGGSGWSWGGSDSGSDNSSGSSEWNPVPYRLFYGRRYILQDYTKVFSDRVPEDKGWWLSRPQHVIGFSYSFGTDERFSVGSSVLFTKLAGKEDVDRTYSPPAPAPNPGKEPADKQYQLETQFDKSALLIGQTIDVEYVFASVADDHLRAFAHADVGYTIYSASADITYFDTCGCSHRAVDVDGSSTVGTASLGVGVQAQLAFVGVKAHLGFQFQQANTFVTRRQYDTWQPEFNDAAYNYNGVPDNSLFRITGSEYERVRSRTNQLYFQVTAYFYLGWSRY